MTVMKKINSIVSAGLILLFIPLALLAQDKKNEQKIKIVVRDDGGSDVVLDTLITGTPQGDSIVLKNGKVVYLASDEGNKGTRVHTRKKYIVTSTEPEGSDSGKEIRKEITVTTSDGDDEDAIEDMTSAEAGSGSSGQARAYSFKVQSDRNDGNSERTRYVIKRDGIVVTVEGSDYDRVKDLIKEIEKSLDEKSESK